MALPHHSHYHKETQKIMLRVQQISGLTIPLVCTEHGQRARAASAGSGCKSHCSSHSEKKLLARAEIQRSCWGAEITGTDVRAREFLARQAHEAQPHGDADPLLGSAEGGGRRAANFHPRHSQAVAGAREGSGAVPVLSSTQLWTQPRLSREHGAA